MKRPTAPGSETREADGPDYSKLHPDDFDQIHQRIYELLEAGPQSPQELSNDDEIETSTAPARRRANEMLDAGYLGKMRDPYNPTSNLYYRIDCGDPLVPLGFSAGPARAADGDGGER